MRLVISLAALLTSICLMQLASGALGPLDALSGVAYEFTTAQTGLLGSAHFFGFLLGCWLAPQIMGSVGHVAWHIHFLLDLSIGGFFVLYLDYQLLELIPLLKPG